MTEEKEYLLKAVAALADALAYMDRVEQIRRGDGRIAAAEAAEWLRKHILRAHDSCAYQYETIR